MLNKDTIVEMLRTNDTAVARALVALNERQTRDEQLSENTKYNNGIGFTGADARMGTSMASFYTRRNYLTAKQIAYWRKPNVKGVPRIAKYAGQLLEIAAEKAAAKAVQAAAQQITGNAAEAMRAEREMQAMEAEGDAEQTRIDELAKFIARCAMERTA